MTSVSKAAAVCSAVALLLLQVSACGEDESETVANAAGAGGSGGSGATWPDGSAGSTNCVPGEQWVCLCYGVPNGTQTCNANGTLDPCPPCDDPDGGVAGTGGGSGGTGGAGTGGVGTGGGTAGAAGACTNSCANGQQDCGEDGVDCGGPCPGCNGVYTEADCIKAARNGSEICDDAAWRVEAPGTGLVLVCITPEGGTIYVSTNTGPPDPPPDGPTRCQGWEINGEDAWDHLNYLYTLVCNQEQDLIDLDLSSYVGQTLYFGAHNNPSGGGEFTHMCLAWKK